VQYFLHLPCLADTVDLGSIHTAAESEPNNHATHDNCNMLCNLPCPADAVPDDMEAAAESSIMERRPLLLTPVPHEQPWATAAWAGHPVEPPTPSELLQHLPVTLVPAMVGVDWCRFVRAALGNSSLVDSPSGATDTNDVM
jgi:hypothetical protein